MRSLTIIVLAFIVTLVATANVTYEGYKVYNVKPTTDAQLELVAGIRENEYLDFWTRLSTPNVPISVMVAPPVQNWFESFLHENQINYGVLIENVAKNIEQEKFSQQIAPKVPLGKISFTNFVRHTEMNAYLKQLARRYPNVASTIKIGKSYEGRDLIILKISSGGSGKPAIFVDAGIHARDWIAPPVALYIINQLVENSQNAHLYQDVDWYVIPSLNPDGYEYTHTNERLWTKTRSRNIICYGTDPNRNFDFHWMENDASSNECSEDYAGYKAFSEVETRALRNFLLSTPNIQLYLTFHSYGQYLLYPWGYTGSLPQNYLELQIVAINVNTAISSVAGTQYTIGSSTNILYASAGNSADYAKGVAGIDLVYTFKLPGGGSYGFDPPATRILPIVQETWEGIKVLQMYIQNKYVPKK